MIICNSEVCTGCAACMNICPVSAITMKADTKGFLRPDVDSDKCIFCKKCIRCCPQNISPSLFQNPRVYAARSLNNSDRRASSSGGLFSLLAEKTLMNGGVVFGAAYTDNLAVKHIAVSNLDDLKRLRGSKYVQSEIGNSYKHAKIILDAAQPVLFSGTPCQIAGLKAYLGKEYDKLLTIDILCHGVPSPAVFRAHLDSLEELVGEPIRDYHFRDKPVGWKNFKSTIHTQNGNIHSLACDPYMDGFLKNIYLRDSCYQCIYASEKREGDITLGDYWGYQERFPDYLMDDDAGMSLVLINSDKGSRAFLSVKKNILTTKRSIEDAKRGNRVLSAPFSQPPQTHELWERFKNESWSDVCNHFSFSKPDFMNLPSTPKKQLQKFYWLQQLKHTIRGLIKAVINQLRRKLV